MTAEVKVKITADGSQVGTAVGKVKKDLAGVKDAGEVLSGAMVKVGGVIAGAFAVSSVTGFLRTVNSATDNLNDLSTRLGASASGLQVLQIAAQQAGGSAEGMGNALAKLQNTIGEGLNGNKAATDAFRQLGVSASELAGLKTDEAMRRVLVALEGVTNANQRAQIGTDLLGRGFKENAGLAADAAGQLAAVEQALKDSGAALDDIDFAKIGLMNDALALQGTVVSNLAAQFISSLTPAVGVATSSVSELIGVMGGATASGRMFGIVMTGAAAGVTAGLALVIEALSVVEAAIAKTIQFAVRENARALGQLGSLASAIGLDGIGGKFQQAAEGSARIAENWGKVADAGYERAQRAGAQLIKSLDDLTSAPTVFDAKASEMEARALEFAAKMKALQGTYNPSAARAGAGTSIGFDVQKSIDARAGGGLLSKELLRDPLMDPEYLMQQSLGTALNELVAQQSTERLTLVDQGHRSILDSFLLNNEFLIAAEDAKNATLGQSLTSMVGLAMQQGGALGKFGKAFAIAQTIWSTGTAVIESFKNAGGFPWGIAPAAAMAATGLAQLANIKKTNIGSGGSVLSARSGGGGGAASVPALSDSVAATAPDQDTRQSVGQIIINGPIMSGQETAQWLIDTLKDAVDRDVVFVSSTSRQALELRAT